MQRTWPRLSFLAFAFVAAVPAVASEPATAEVSVLQSSPACVQKRLGQVSVSTGSKELDLRSGMPPASVSYRKAFAQLLEKTKERGADAVVLRSHEAAYLGKGGRSARRPTYLSLQGTAVLLDANRSGCTLVLVDLVEFERKALDRQRQEVVEDAGVSF